MTALTNVTLASSNSALPDDGGYIETRWSRFNVDFIIPLKACSSIGVKTLIVLQIVMFIAPFVRYKTNVVDTIFHLAASFDM